MATAEVAAGPLPAGRRPGSVIAGVTARKAVRSGALWGYVFGAFVASSALGYAATYSTQAARDHLAATFGNNAGIDALIGRAHDIQTVAGFTAWRSLGVLGIVGAVWGVLAATRLLRGEEDAGRWEVLLAGQTTRRGAAAQGLFGLAAGAATLFAVTGAVTVVIGRLAKVHLDVTESLFLALSLVAPAVVFLAVGALTSQLAGTRRRAAAYGGVAVGVSYALRLVADSGTSFGWLRWVTPLGWVEELRPATAPRPLVLVPIAALVVVAAALTVVLAARRDLGGSVVPEHTSAEAHVGLLSGPTGLAFRLARPAVGGWLVAVAATAFLVAFIAKPAGDAITTSTSARQALARLGAAGTGAKVFLGVTFLVLGLLVAFIAASQATGARAMEAQGELEHLLVRPVSRWSWLASTLGVAVASLVLSSPVVGVAAWLGAAAQHGGVSFSSLLGAGFNILPPALLVLGAGTLALGLWPRAVGVVTYGVLSWSFLVSLAGGFVGLNHWLLDTSVFHQMTPAPAVAPNWTTNAAMTAVAVVAAAVGAFAFASRDLQGE